ncbi:hypothetical protein QFZ70_002983 [Arthrobacter sp. V1I9]|jgi:hypothetical protein|uniref:hypothetical protein n=1 Tax=Arthrobacter sp. V1I9 TaxID=3042275 RepID=UPI0027932B7E|nr:hypothetical protein [Arthrobacter sp. V1I9]MDQ0870510.1 hypothetical protein [Arthrobacter sp. V1I9]
MTASTALTPVDLDAEVVELLPMKETLYFNINVSPVIAVNLSMAVNAASIGSIANSAALQDILVLQE